MPQRPSTPRLDRSAVAARGGAAAVAALLLALTAGCAGSAAGSGTAAGGTARSSAPAAGATPSGPPAVTRLVGNGTPNPGTRYEAAEVPVPFTFTVPRKDGVPGTWMYGNGPQLHLGLRNSPQTGHASTVLAALDEVYAPTLAQPFVGKTETVPAPTTADGWEQWLRSTGQAVVTDRQELEVGGLRLVRLRVDVADDLPSSGYPCAEDESCLPLSPRGPALVGMTRGLPWAAELAVLELEGRSLVAASFGNAKTVDQWLPLMHAVHESIQL